jgi:hypothetical protein
MAEHSGSTACVLTFLVAFLVFLPELSNAVVINAQDKQIVQDWLRYF